MNNIDTCYTCINKVYNFHYSSYSTNEDALFIIVVHTSLSSTSCNTSHPPVDSDPPLTTWDHPVTPWLGQSS